MLERRESQPQEDVLMGDVRKPDSFPDNVMGYNALDNFIRWDPDNSSGKDTRSSWIIESKYSYWFRVWKPST